MNSELIAKPLVSVRVLAYNHEKYIAQCLDGILMQQTNFPFELIIGEDCSSDSTAEICRQYKRRYPSIINLISNEKNLGVYENGQKTIAQYRGKYIAWCDGDDFWSDPQKLQKQVDILENRPDIAVCFHNVKIINEQNGEKARLSNIGQKQISTIYDLTKGNFIYSASCLFRHNLFGEYPDFVRNMPAGDYVVHILNASKGDLYYIDEVMACYRIHNAGLWESKSQIERYEKWLVVQKALIGLFNPQLDSVLKQAQASIYHKLAVDARKNNKLKHQKEYLLSGIELLLEETNQSEALALVNIMLADLQPLVDTEIDFLPMYYLGILSFKKAMFADAILFLNDALKLNSKLIEAHKFIAKSHAKLEDLNSAVKHLSIYLASNPNNPEIILLLCDYLLELGSNEQKVINILDRLKSKINIDNQYYFKILKLLGIAYFNLKDYAVSLQFLEEAKSIIDYDIELISMISKIKMMNSNQAIEAENIDNFILTSVADEVETKDISQRHIEPIVRPDGRKARVSIVIPIYNRIELTKECIESVYRVGSQYEYEIIVVDNASSDGSLEYLKEQATVRSNFRFLRNSKNLGFAKACNLGIRAANNDYVLLLNNDIIVLDGWLDSLINAAESDKRIAIAGSLLLYPDGKTIQHCGVRLCDVDDVVNPFHIHKLRQLDRTPEALQSTYLSVVTGACMLIRVEHLSEIGVLDEEYLNSYEDVDYCLRAKEAGYRVYYCAESRLLHYESVSPNRHDNDEKNWERLNAKWYDKVKFDGSDYYIYSLYELWFREELVKFPENAEYLEKLVQVLHFKNELDEAKIYEEKLSRVSKNVQKSQSQKTVSFVMLVRNNLEYTQTCVDSIFETCKGIDFEIVVVDNNSDYQTQDYLASLEQKNASITVIRNADNKSYSIANNQGAKVANAKYLIFINNDIKLLENSIQAIIQKFEQDETIGVQGAKLLYPNNTIQHCGMVWGNVSANLELHYHIYLTMPANSDCVNRSREYQFVTGALLAIRSELFDAISGFDEQYYFGHEDLDLCLAARKQGRKVWYNSSAVAYHYESITKKSEGIEKFERFISHPDSFDAQNHKYFLTKWGTILINDADSYFANDGMLAFSSNSAIRESFQQRIESIITMLTELKNSDQEQYLRILQVLFGAELLTQKNAAINPAYISDEKLRIAELMLDENEAEAFDLEDIFDNVTYEAKTEIEIRKPLKILMTMYGWNESGGGTTFPKSVAKRLVQKGNQVSVFYATAKHSISQEPYYLEHSNDEGVELWGVYNRPTVFLDADNPEREVRDDNILKHFEKILDEFQPDIVHFNNFLGLSFAIAEMAKSKGYPTIYTPYNYHLIDPTLYLYRSDLSLWSNTDFFANSELPSRNPNKLKAYEHRIEAAKELLNLHIDYTFAVSNRVKNILVEFGANPDKITVIHQVHETVEKLDAAGNISQKHSPLRFGFIGGVMPHKGTHIIVQAAQLLPIGSAEFYVYGFVSDNYAQLLKSLDRKGIVKMMGAYDSDDLPKIASELSAMILPSLWEDCAPFVITESLAMKLPVICTNIGGFPDFIKDNINGKLFAYNSPSELAKVIQSTISNPKTIDNWKENCNLSFTFDDHIEHLIGVLSRICEGEAPTISEMELIF